MFHVAPVDAAAVTVVVVVVEVGVVVVEAGVEVIEATCALAGVLPIPSVPHCHPSSCAYRMEDFSRKPIRLCQDPHNTTKCLG